MAMDYLPGQASSVPAERVFSSSAETDTRRRNRIAPHLMEQLQMLKFMLKKARLDFMSVWCYDAEDAEVENEWLDRGASFGAGDDNPAFYSLLDLLEEVTHDGEPSARTYPDMHNFEEGEVIQFDDDDTSYSDEWADEV
jgi:hypothetical protein